MNSPAFHGAAPGMPFRRRHRRLLFVRAGAVIHVADTAPPEVVVTGERFTLATVAGVPTALGRIE